MQICQWKIFYNTNQKYYNLALFLVSSKTCSCLSLSLGDTYILYSYEINRQGLLFVPHFIEKIKCKKKDFSHLAPGNLVTVHSD